MFIAFIDCAYGIVKFYVKRTTIFYDLFKVAKYPINDIEVNYNLIDVIDNCVYLTTTKVSQALNLLFNKGDKETIMSIQ